MSFAADHAALLRFVAGKIATDTDARTIAMVTVLERAAQAAEAGITLNIPADGLEMAARALAGFAAFLQQRILPEAVAHGNSAGETQIRWSVDRAMEMVNTLLAQAAMPDRPAANLSLPSQGCI